MLMHLGDHRKDFTGHQIVARESRTYFYGSRHLHSEADATRHLRNYFRV